MTRTLLISSVAGLALLAPTAATANTLDVAIDAQERAGQDRTDRRAERRQERRQERRVEQRKEGRQADARQERRAERRQDVREERRRETRQEQRQQARQAEARQERRQERRQEARQAEARQERRVERRQEARQAERRQEARQVERRQERRIEQRQAQRADIAEQRRLRQQGDRMRARAMDRQAERREERRAEARLDRRLDNREIRQAIRQTAQRAERRAERRGAYRDWIRDRDRYRTARYDGGARFVTVGSRVSPDWYSTRIPYAYRSRYADSRDHYYRYDDDLDFLYRIDRRRNLVSSIIPLGYSYGMIGQPLPSYYQSSYVPYGYSRYYYDTPSNYYRQVGPAVYGMNPETMLLTSVVALLTGSNFSIGQAMPAGYDTYNVPMAYRDRYYDSDDAWYRYNNGSIYQIDPYSRRVVDAYPLYGASYGVGQRWPTAYPDYNVPYGYQGMYYDTPQYDYRYANGNIYRVDPTTQVIQALVSLVTGNNFAVGQPMPMGYDVYNVPYQYRSRYADTDDRWYRYNDGYIYAVDRGNRLIVDRYPLYS